MPKRSCPGGSNPAGIIAKDKNFIGVTIEVFGRDLKCFIFFHNVNSFILINVFDGTIKKPIVPRSVALLAVWCNFYTNLMQTHPVLLL